MDVAHLRCYTAPENIVWKNGRAKRGVSGTLNSQSAIARLNAFPRIVGVEPLLP